MRLLNFVILPVFLLASYSIQSQNIGDFTSITPTTQTSGFVIPSSHAFQRIIKVGDPLSVSGSMLTKPDFTAYVPVANSSTNGYLSVNSEDAPFFPGTGGGGVTVLDINFNGTTNLWETTASQTINFASVGGTAANCSGTVTPWGTVITCEEAVIGDLLVPDGYNDLGWNIEINPASKTVIGKHYAMGNMAHENVTIHPNQRTVYQGADSNPGYLYKFVADNAQDLSSGSLYVYTGSKNSSGTWALINNSNQAEQNTTLSQSATIANVAVFNGIEDVEIGPDGMVYFAVKNEGVVYRFSDSDPLETIESTITMETFVGGMSYDINDGASTTSVAWGNGNDNLAFDGDGNLWVLQDGGNNYIWVVKNGHTQVNPEVEIFGSAPTGSEPTGITFTPDYKYLFMSIMLSTDPSSNNAGQIDAAGSIVDFNTGTSIVVALSENLGSALSVETNNFTNKFKFYPNPTGKFESFTIKGNQINNIKIYSVLGKKLLDIDYNGLNEVKLSLKNINSGLYLFKINNNYTSKLIIK